MKQRKKIKQEGQYQKIWKKKKKAKDVRGYGRVKVYHTEAIDPTVARNIYKTNKRKKIQ